VGSFVIAYVPQVDYIETLNLVNRVEKVGEIEKFPTPLFPRKTHNYQVGGMIHIPATTGSHFAVLNVDKAAEYKGINICFTAYNIEDTFDVLVGSRPVIKNSHVKEMSEFREMIVCEMIPQNTPLTIEFKNNSGLEKYLMYDHIMVIDTDVVNTPNTLEWNFVWRDDIVQLGAEDTLTLMVIQPNYVNADSTINEFTLTVKDKNIPANVLGTITCSGGTVDGFPLTSGDLRVLNVEKFPRYIAITIKNISQILSHPVALEIVGSVVNIG
jgi:hypothetical protein